MAMRDLIARGSADSKSLFERSYRKVDFYCLGWNVLHAKVFVEASWPWNAIQ
jgi:hypothetical protein